MDNVIVRLLKTLLTTRSAPVVSAITVLTLGVFLSLLVLNDPKSAVWIIGAITLVAFSYILFLAYALRKQTLRLSDIASVKHYRYDTVRTELTWMIEDTKGESAKLVKRKVIRALEQLYAIKEYNWGDGGRPSYQDLEIGSHHIGDISRMGSCHVVEINFDKPYDTGDEFELSYSRRINNGFTNKDEWIETTVMTNTDTIILSVVFPFERSYKETTAIHKHGDFSFVSELGNDHFVTGTSENGNQILKWTIRKPIQRDTYAIEWRW